MVVLVQRVSKTTRPSSRLPWRLHHPISSPIQRARSHSPPLFPPYILLPSIIPLHPTLLPPRLQVWRYPEQAHLLPHHPPSLPRPTRRPPPPPPRPAQCVKAGIPSEDHPIRHVAAAAAPAPAPVCQNRRGLDLATTHGSGSSSGGRSKRDKNRCTPTCALAPSCGQGRSSQARSPSQPTSAQPALPPLQPSSARPTSPSRRIGAQRGGSSSIRRPSTLSRRSQETSPPGAISRAAR